MSKSRNVTIVTNRVRRVLVLGALAGAAAAWSVYFFSAAGPNRLEADCTALFGSFNDGVCISEPIDTGAAPPIWIGPNEDGNATGVTTGPLLPGRTINIPLGP
jgi:hypothetical protein